MASVRLTRRIKPTEPAAYNVNGRNAGEWWICSDNVHEAMVPRYDPIERCGILVELARGEPAEFGKVTREVCLAQDLRSKVQVSTMKERVQLDCARE